MKADIIIRNGLVIEPSDNSAKVMDVAIGKGKILQKGKLDTGIKANIEVDATGCLVTPGLIDCHLHLFAGSGESGLKPDITFLPYGVTSGVDGGSAGISNYKLFSNIIVHHSVTTVKAYLNPSPAGHAMIKYYPENVDPKYFDVERIAECVERYKGEIVAIKMRISKNIVGDLGLKPLEAAVEIGNRVGLPVVVHTTNPPTEVEEVLSILRPGDVFGHAFHGNGECIIGKDGSIKDCVWEARKRGVLFDVANGIGHFVISVAKQALAEGFLPDTISTDVTTKSMYRQPVHSMPFIMSKYLSMGMSIQDVIMATTLRPAQIFGFEGMGTLREGTVADVAVFRLIDKPMKFMDTNGDYYDGNKALIPQMTVKDGVIRYRQVDF